MPDLISILLVDGMPLFRLGLAEALAAERSFYICGEAGTQDDALRLARELLPAVVLLDANMPGQASLEITERIRQACPATAVLLVAKNCRKDSLLAGFKAGARGFVLKTALSDELVNAVQAVNAGNLYVSPPVSALLMDLLTHTAPPNPLNVLTSREREILAFIGNGLTNREIGEKVFLSEKTIKHYVTNILQKLQVRSRVQAALFVSRQALTA